MSATSSPVRIWPNRVSLNIGVQVMNALLPPLVLGFLVTFSVRALPPAVRLRGWCERMVVVIGLTILLGVFGGLWPATTSGKPDVPELRPSQADAPAMLRSYSVGRFINQKTPLLP